MMRTADDNESTHSFLASFPKATRTQSRREAKSSSRLRVCARCWLAEVRFRHLVKKVALCAGNRPSLRARSLLKRHVKAVHLKEMDIIVCDICPFCTSEISTILIHSFIHSFIFGIFLLPLTDILMQCTKPEAIPVQQRVEPDVIHVSALKLPTRYAAVENSLRLPFDL